MKRADIRVDTIDGELMFLIPVRLLMLLVQAFSAAAKPLSPPPLPPPDAGDDVEAATIKLLTGKPEGLSPTALFRQLDASGFSYHSELPWEERRARYSSHLWRMADSGQLVHVCRGRYAAPRHGPRLIVSTADADHSYNFDRFIERYTPLVAMGLCILSGWFLKPVHISNLIGESHRLWG